MTLNGDKIDQEVLEALKVIGIDQGVRLPNLPAAIPSDGWFESKPPPQIVWSTTTGNSSQ
jgi:hypothetical protein